MQKIPTLFVRDPENRKLVLPQVTPGCEWVLAGEGTATRKYDGTCVLVDDQGFVWCRREVKPGKDAPEDWREVAQDETTGKRVGWEPYSASGFAQWIVEAVNNAGGWDSDDGSTPALDPGTYELCGPKVNGDPEGYGEHVLISHAGAERLGWANLPTIEELWRVMPQMRWEGIVWHHPDGRMAKLKVRDFPAVSA
jgi:hypothetical protein